MKSFFRKMSREGRTARGTNVRKAFETLEGRQLFSAVTSATPLLPPSGSMVLTGNVIGTAGSYQNKGNTIAKAFDGNTGTYFDALGANGNWVGLDLGAPEVISQIQYVPRVSFTSRMVGGVFQGSNVADFSSGVSTLLTVTSTPATGVYTISAVNNPGSFEFVRYVAPANSYGNVSEIEFDGYSNIPTTVPDAPSTPAATSTTPGDVHLSWTEDFTSIVSGYTIERQGPNDSDFVAIATTTGSATTFDDLTAAASTGYAYAVVANNSLGSSPFSSAATITTPAPFVNSWTDSDIGSPAKAGGAVVSPSGTITVTGGGADIWTQTDQFNFNYETLTGNGSIVTQVMSQTNSNSWAKSGIMIRESTNADSRYVLLALTPGYGVTFQARTATHSPSTINITTPGKAGVWLQLTRNGSSIIGSMSTDGTNWTVVGSVNITMVNNVCAGLAVTAHNNATSSKATFANTAVASSGTTASVWSDATNAPVFRWESENFSYNGKLYIFGGFDDRTLDATAECDVYDPVADTWTYLGTIPAGALTHAATTVVGDTAYFAGGDIGTFSEGTKTSTSTSEVITYDVTTGKWGSVQSMPVAASCGGLVCVNNELIYFGGLNANDTADSSLTWSLDLTDANAKWVAEAAMPDARNHLGAAVINGVVYAVGGWHLYNTVSSNDATVDAYNPVTNKWTAVTSLPRPMSSLETSTIVVNNKIVVVGGQTNGGYDGIYQNTILEFDPTTSKWTQPGTIPEANEGLSVAYIDNELVVVGGTVDYQGGWSQDQTWINPTISL